MDINIKTFIRYHFVPSCTILITDPSKNLFNIIPPPTSSLSWGCFGIAFSIKILHASIVSHTLTEGTKKMKWT